MISPTIKRIFDWDAIEIEICKKMNITESQFRDYHYVVGGDYKDLWHDWMEYFDYDVRNDSCNDLYISNDDLEDKINQVTRDEKTYLIPFVKAVTEIFEENQIRTVRYSW